MSVTELTMGTKYFDGVEREAMQRLADWYGFGFFGATFFAMAQCNARDVRYEWGPAAGDGIRFGDPNYIWRIGPFVPAVAPAPEGE